MLAHISPEKVTQQTLTGDPFSPAGPIGPCPPLWPGSPMPPEGPTGPRSPGEPWRKSGGPGMATTAGLLAPVSESILEHLRDDALHKPQRLPPSSAEDHKAQHELPTCLFPSCPHSLRPSYTDLAVSHTPGPLHTLLFLPRNPPPDITGLHARLLWILAPQGCLPQPAC